MISTDYPQLDWYSPTIFSNTRWSVLFLPSLSLSVCSKPRPNVVYQPPSVYGDEDADVRRSLSLLNFKPLSWKKVAQMIFGPFFFFRGISNRSHHLWYSRHKPNTSGPALQRWTLVTVPSIIFLPSMKFQLLQTSKIVLSEPNEVNGVWDTSTGTKTKWINVLEPSSGMYHGCRFKWVVSADIFDLCPCVHQLFL